VLLFVSLFLTWSHQFSTPFFQQFAESALLRDIPRDPTAWQVYSSADVLLALLAVALVPIGLVGGRRAMLGGLVGALLALAFTLRALSSPPTNGANIFNPALNVPQLVSSGATAGPGETLAIVGLLVAIVGLGLSLWSGSARSRDSGG
jgi:hypothetical protein